MSFLLHLVTESFVFDLGFSNYTLEVWSPLTFLNGLIPEQELIGEKHLNLAKFCPKPEHRFAVLFVSLRGGRVFVPFARLTGCLQTHRRAEFTPQTSARTLAAGLQPG